MMHDRKPDGTPIQGRGGLRQTSGDEAPTEPRGIVPSFRSHIPVAINPQLPGGVYDAFWNESSEGHWAMCDGLAAELQREVSCKYYLFSAIPATCARIVQTTAMFLSHTYRHRKTKSIRMTKLVFFICACCEVPSSKNKKAHP